jgi:hypothetical protein
MTVWFWWYLDWQIGAFRGFWESCFGPIEAFLRKLVRGKFIGNFTTNNFPLFKFPEKPRFPWLFQNFLTSPSIHYQLLIYFLLSSIVFMIASWKWNLVANQFPDVDLEFRAVILIGVAFVHAPVAGVFYKNQISLGIKFCGLDCYDNDPN